MMRKGGGGNAELFLDFPGDHPGGVSGKQQTHDLQARLGPDSGKTVGATGDEEGVGLLHISIIAEI